MIGLHVINTVTGKTGIITKQLKNGNYRISVEATTEQFKLWSGEVRHFMTTRSGYYGSSYNGITGDTIRAEMTRLEHNYVSVIQRGSASSFDDLTAQVLHYRERLARRYKVLSELAEQNRKLLG